MKSEQPKLSKETIRIIHVSNASEENHTQPKYFMENYTTRLQEQVKALQADICKMIEEIKADELKIDEKKQHKSLAFRELRSIEKKLEKLKV